MLEIFSFRMQRNASQLFQQEDTKKIIVITLDLFAVNEIRTSRTTQAVQSEFKFCASKT